MWLSLQSGYFNDDARSDEDKIPDSNTKMHLLSFKLATRVLENMSEGCLSTRQAMMLRKIDNKVVHKLFYFGACERAENKVWTHSVQEFEVEYSRRAACLGHRLKQPKVHDDSGAIE